MYLARSYFLIGFHLKSFIKSLIFKIFFSAWCGRLAQKQAQSMPVRHSIRATDWDCGFDVNTCLLKRQDPQYTRAYAYAVYYTLLQKYAIDISTCLFYRYHSD